MKQLLVQAMVTGIATLASLGTAWSADVVVYSERKEHLIAPMFAKFTEATGITVDYVTDNAAVLIERLAAEGENTPADMLMTVDAGNLWQATERGVLQPVETPALLANVPEALRDPDCHWYGLSQRARTVVYSTERVDSDNLESYAALGDDRWEGRLCLRTSKKVYNQSLVATMIEREGAEATQNTVESWVENLAAPPMTSDTVLLEAIAAGQCDVGIVNTYYLGRLVADNPTFPVRPFWQAKDHGGVHVNISGAGITRHADNVEDATRLLEWLSGAEAQAEFARLNIEYPVRPGTPLDPILVGWGPFDADDVNLSVAGSRQAEAVKLMDRAGYR